MLIDNDSDAIIRFGRGIFARESVMDQLTHISVPTLVIVGEKDTPQPPARAQRTAAEIPGSELLIVPNTAHITSLDNPDIVNAALEQHVAHHG